MPETTGKLRTITRWGNPVLHAECRDVTDYDDDLRHLVADMWVTMRASDGVGLAANQVGVDLKLFIFDCPDADGTYHSGVVCNPVLQVPDGSDRKLEEVAEGCLSLPGSYADLARATLASVTGTDEHGNPVSYSGTGMLARCLQHETDHLYGTVFGDRLTRKQRKLLFAEADEVAWRYPADWPVSDALPDPDEDDGEDPPHNSDQGEEL